MKKLQFSIAPLLACLLFFSGCAGTLTVPGKTAAQIRNFISATEPSIRPTTRTVCALALLAVKPEDREATKAAIFKASSVVAASNGMSPEQLTAAIMAAIGDTPDNRALATAIAGVYGIAFPFITGDPQLLLKVLGDIAAGCADATRAPAAMYQEFIHDPMSLTNRHREIALRLSPRRAPGPMWISIMHRNGIEVSP